MTTLILTRKDISGLITMKETLKAVERSFTDYTLGRAIMPPKAYLTLETGDFRAMPAAIPGAAGMKWVNVHSGNATKGLPSVMGIIIYSDPYTGYPLAIMDGTQITAYRTGAAAAIASKYLALKDANSLGLIGTGNQADTQLMAHLEYFKFNEILVYDRSVEAAEKFKARHPKLPVKVTGLEIACNADIVCTLTPSRTPYLRREWLKYGAHVNAIGADAPGKQELEQAVLDGAMVVVDDIYQSTHAGELNVPIAQRLFSESQIFATLGELTSGQKQGRSNDSDITVFDSTGLAIQDIACAKLIYEKALSRNLGQFFDFIQN
ncbi:ornithine cyclodeaminase [Dehalogenimonas sp. WBC-2]|nr:ornithine cyclodeaminase [Dehalogenimonas sp. WBC-2]